MEAANPACHVVRGDRGRGRFTVAARPLVPGEIVLAEHAVACVAAPGRSLCDDCLTSIDRREGDSQCIDCSRSSSRAALQGSSVRVHEPLTASSAVRLAAKIVFRRCSGFLTHVQASMIDNLIHDNDEQQQQLSSRRAIPIDRHEREEENGTQVAKLVTAMDGCAAVGETGSLLPLDCRGDKGAPSAALLILAKKELDRVSLNAITTCDGSGATGLGLFPSAAMFNHACTPNCQAWWRGSKLEIRCTKSVAAGEELCFSYIPIDQPSAVRQAQLRYSWLFTCSCRRCESGQWDAELLGLRCPLESCSGAVPPPWSKDDRNGSSWASCNKCDSRAVSGCSTAQEVRKSGSAADVMPLGKANAWCWIGSASGEQALYDIKSCEDNLLQASTDFERGMEAYMQEDPEVAFVELEKSLLARERFLHPFNKELLRTLRYASYAAVATHRWAKAHSFLARWLHPMETMFGAAEVWDIAAMRIDAGLVLDKLHPGTVPVSSSLSPPGRGSLGKNTPLEQARDAMNPAAYGELVEGLRWIWICLGKETTLPSETAALEACASYGADL